MWCHCLQKDTQKYSKSLIRTFSRWFRGSEAAVSLLLPYDICRRSVGRPRWCRCCRPRETGRPSARLTRTWRTRFSPTTDGHVKQQRVTLLFTAVTVKSRNTSSWMRLPFLPASDLPEARQEAGPARSRHKLSSRPGSRAWSGLDWHPGLETQTGRNNGIY